MNLSDFDFELPDEAIALRPASPRDSARLLVVGKQSLKDLHVSDLPKLLKSGDLLVVNTSRVFPASLKGIRPARPEGGGGDVSVQVNLHKNISERNWRAFVKPAKRLRLGDGLHFSSQLKGTVTEKFDGGEIELQFNLNGDELMQAFGDVGQMPLPPYIARQRAVDEQDNEDYQTVYADKTGSVAAPTAGLHFTKYLLAKLEEKGVAIASVTLHVGAGTFLPVKTENVSQHVMHEEWYEVSEDVAKKINATKAAGGRVIAVGTTSLRALESASQGGRMTAKSGATDIFITPGYEFQVIDGLMTNFHLPKSTLFMLVCAMGGIRAMQGAYAHAIASGYKFYSYGDASLIWAN